MSEQSFKEASEKYRSEMMKIYKARSSPTETSNDSYQSEPPAYTADEDTPEITPGEPEILNESEPIINQEDNEDNIEERFPPPEIPAFMQMDDSTARPQPEPAVSFENGQTENISKIREAQLPDYSMVNPPDYSGREAEPDFEANPEYTKWGYIKISVRTGSGGIPIPDASVTLTREYNGNEELLVLTTTDINGETEVFRLPAPPVGNGNAPEDYEHYSTYSAEVYAKGYFREVSRNIPVFENITSVQSFNLIPEPYSFDSGGNHIVYENTEPNF